MVKSMILSWEKEKLEKVKVLRGNFGESFDYDKFYYKCFIFLFIIYFIKVFIYNYFTLSLARVSWGFSCS